MYIHLGGDTVVRVSNIIAMFDLDTASVSKITREYLSTIEDRGQVVDVSGEIPKSFVVCEIDNRSVIYLSQISTQTLLKRAEFLDGIANV